MSQNPAIIALSNRGLCQIEGPPGSLGEQWLQEEKAANFRNIIFSPKGSFVACRSDKSVDVIRCTDWSTVFSLPGKGIKEMQFSPLDTFFTIWEIYIQNDEFPKGKQNVHIHKVATGERIQSYTQKQQTGWEPQWSQDEKLFTLLENGRVLVYEDANFDRYTHQILGQKIKNYSLAPTPSAPYHFAIFSEGKSGQPAMYKVFKFPDFEATQTLVSRSSFQSDRCVFHWNRRGTNLLVMTHSDVDKTGSSYYGKTTLSFADVKGNAGNVVLGKEGPIHAICWNPGNWNEWVAVYGHAPAKATLFNTACKPLLEFGTGSWNSAYFSPDGSRLLFGGFGNIGTGAVDVWDPKSFKKLSSFIAQDTTFLQWDPRSECILTATTYPRLTVNNGFKIWHYTGALMHKRSFDNEQLLFILWQPGTFSKSELSTSVPKAIEDSTAKPASAPYRPPRATQAVKFTLHEHEAPHKPGANDAPSKAAIKQKEKRERLKAKKAEERAKDECGDSPKHQQRPATTQANAPPKSPAQTTGDPEKDKKIKALNKKLSDIAKLKQIKSEGKSLELNQQAKIDSEASILKEIEALRL